MTSLRNAGRFDEEFPTFYRKEKNEKEAFDEGVFVSDFLNDEEQAEEDFFREPSAQFENYLSKLDGATQFLIHDLKVLESKNEVTGRRIVKLSQDAAEFRAKLTAFLQSYDRRSSWRELVKPSSKSVAMTSPRGHDVTVSSPRRQHKTTYAIFLKQNSIEQPVHVNIVLDDTDNILRY